MNMEQLQKENDELRAHVERLREVICNISDELYGKGFDVLNLHLNGDTEPLDNWFEENDWLSVLDETPPQSLRHIESRVEEETIGRYKARLKIKGYLVAAYEADKVPRKYLNKTETVTKDGE